MRLLACCAAALSLVLAACGSGAAPNGVTSCARDRDCPAGQGCQQGTCAPLPCGGCQDNQACGADGKCVSAQGATCGDHTCPAAYPCNGAVCAKACTLNTDCDAGFVCNSGLKTCAECTFDSQCATKTGRTHCNADTGQCVACNVNFDCVQALGSSHYCDAHVCKPGCKTNADCNASQGETCDTSTTPGRCIQCRSNNDCAAFTGQQACDDTGHCVQCWGATQDAANTTCDPNAAPECNLKTKTCVQCLPANDDNGKDCGAVVYRGGPKDPHVLRRCNPSTLSCEDGCATDNQCGCPRDAQGNELNCHDADGTTARLANQEHCDPALRAMVGQGAPPVDGACVQCREGHNEDCSYKVTGSSQYGGAYASLHGARCVSDACNEGCDTDNDCWPDRVTPNGRTCHLGNPGDPNNHKCVECGCDQGLDPDGTYCSSNSQGAACARDANGNPRVCDANTLLCRKKRQNEICTNSGECGDIHDPTVGGCSPMAVCIFSSHTEPVPGPEQFCSADHATGRCGVPCNDYQNNACDGTQSPVIPCPSGTQCNAATTDAAPGHGSYCVSTTCTNQ